MWNLFPAEDQAYHLVCSSNKVSTLGPNLANVVGALVCSNTLLGNRDCEVLLDSTTLLFLFSNNTL